MATTGPSKGEVAHRGCVVAPVGVLKAALLCTAVDVFPEAEVPGKGLMWVLSHSGNTQELSQWCKRSRTGRELIKLIYHYIIRQHFALSTSGSVRASRERSSRWGNVANPAVTLLCSLSCLGEKL